jgi:DNA-binding NtrC family response regulator
LGGVKDLTNQSRIVTATHRDLWQLIRGGTFREDLYHRISVLPITLPPLRARVQDIALLARFFIQRFAQHRDLRLSDEALMALQSYHWPGNVRELRNVIQRAIVMVNGREISASDLHIRPEYTDNASHLVSGGSPSGSAPYHGAGSGGHPYHPAPSYPPTGSGAHPPVPYAEISTRSPSGGVLPHESAQDTTTSLDETERLAIVQALEGCRGNVTEAARRLGIGRSSLYSKMNRHGIVSVHYKSR